MQYNSILGVQMFKTERLESFFLEDSYNISVVGAPCCGYALLPKRMIVKMCNFLFNLETHAKSFIS